MHHHIAVMNDVTTISLSLFMWDNKLENTDLRKPIGLQKAVLPGLENFQQFEKIGEGAYGVVYKAIEQRFKKPAAIKMIDLDEEEGIPATTVREISLLHELQHPNIVSLNKVIFDEHQIYLIFEFVEMDLRRYIDLIADDETMDRTKPENILVNAKDTIKLADFGLARVIGIPVRAYTQEIVTLWYRAPEILLGTKLYSMEIDIWSIGCIYAEMASKITLFMGDSEIAQIFAIFRIMSTPTEETWRGVSNLPHYSIKFPQWKKCSLQKILSKYMDSGGLKILQAMLTYNPAERISAKKLLKDPYFNDVNREELPAGDYDGTLKLPSGH
ncbi:Cyclin-dependent kinase 1 [Dirofilaria immitis]|nr:Cyclin-dependent kinase 1 [Dirofilaria immitis]